MLSKTSLAVVSPLAILIVGVSYSVSSICAAATAPPISLLLFDVMARRPMMFSFRSVLLLSNSSKAISSSLSGNNKLMPFRNGTCSISKAVSASLLLDDPIRKGSARMTPTRFVSRHQSPRKFPCCDRGMPRESSMD